MTVQCCQYLAVTCKEIIFLCKEELFLKWSSVLVWGYVPMLSWKPSDRAAGRMVVRQQGWHSVCSADAALCSREVPRWWRLSGVSRGVITFQRKNKQTSLRQTESLIEKPFICKGSIAGGLFFQEKSIFGNMILVFSFWYLGGKDESLPVFAFCEPWKQSTQRQMRCCNLYSKYPKAERLPTATLCSDLFCHVFVVGHVSH